MINLKQKNVQISSICVTLHQNGPQSAIFTVGGGNSLIAIRTMSIDNFLPGCFPYIGKGLLFLFTTTPPDDQNHLPQLQSDLIPVA